mmetsp:Transcript_7001/g.14285  ORF Transcript_7001/g.14285 Transcript_7001/m.14285 type:complete len:101 (-) Transcript_7001:30-332(-)
MENSRYFPFNKKKNAMRAPIILQIVKCVTYRVAAINVTFLTTRLNQASTRLAWLAFCHPFYTCQEIEDDSKEVEKHGNICYTKIKQWSCQGDLVKAMKTK